jgi:hypothetical protein
MNSELETLQKIYDEIKSDYSEFERGFLNKNMHLFMLDLVDRFLQITHHIRTEVQGWWVKPEYKKLDSRIENWVYFLANNYEIKAYEVKTDYRDYYEEITRTKQRDDRSMFNLSNSGFKPNMSGFTAVVEPNSPAPEPLQFKPNNRPINNRPTVEVGGRSVRKSVRKSLRRKNKAGKKSKTVKSRRI